MSTKLQNKRNLTRLQKKINAAKTIIAGFTYIENKEMQDNNLFSVQNYKQFVKAHPELQNAIVLSNDYKVTKYAFSVSTIAVFVTYKINDTQSISLGFMAATAPLSGKPYYQFAGFLINEYDTTVDYSEQENLFHANN